MREAKKYALGLRKTRVRWRIGKDIDMYLHTSLNARRHLVLDLQFYYYSLSISNQGKCPLTGEHRGEFAANTIPNGNNTTPRQVLPPTQIR